MLIALDLGTVAALQAHRQAQAIIRPRFGPYDEDADLVFARPDGSRMDPIRSAAALSGSSEACRFR